MKHSLKVLKKNYLEELEDISSQSEYWDHDLINDLAKTYADEASFSGHDCKKVYEYLINAALTK